MPVQQAVRVIAAVGKTAWKVAKHPTTGKVLNTVITVVSIWGGRKGPSAGPRKSN